jgi:hypothetical protein
VGPAYKLGFQHANLLAAMALFSGNLDSLHSYPLYSALLTGDNACKKIDYPSLKEGSNDRFTWKVEQQQTHAESYLQGPPRPDESPGFFPYHVVAGPHSMAIYSSFGYSPEQLVFEIRPEVFLEDKERAKALFLCFNDHQHNKVLVAGQKATCFTLQDPLQITLGALNIHVNFEIISGDGEFIGHILRANRSGHPHDRFTANDVQIALRALRGSTPTQIRVHLRF